MFIILMLIICLEYMIYIEGIIWWNIILILIYFESIEGLNWEHAVKRLSTLLPHFFRGKENFSFLICWLVLKNDTKNLHALKNEIWMQNLHARKNNKRDMKKDLLNGTP